MDVEIIDHGMDEYFQAMALLETQTINAGILSSAGGDIASIAFWNHEGTSRGIPPRPFISQTVESKGGAIGSLLQGAIAAIMTPGDVSTALNRVGLGVQSLLKSGVVGGGWAPNHPNTIRQKGSSQPLVDTGRLIGAISYEIK